MEVEVTENASTTLLLLCFPPRPVWDMVSLFLMSDRQSNEVSSSEEITLANKRLWLKPLSLNLCLWSGTGTVTNSFGQGRKVLAKADNKAPRGEAR